MVLPLSKARRSAIGIALVALVVLYVLPMVGYDVCYAFNPQDTSVTLVWTATGDDGYIGRARYYDLRFSTERIGEDTSLWWAEAERVDSMPRPLWSGSPETITIARLVTGQTYYFAIKAADEAYNWSPISNVTCINCYKCGDINADGTVDISDLVHLLSYYFMNGPPPLDPAAADVSGPDGVVNVVDIVKLIDYLFNYGAPLDCNLNQD